MRSPARDLIAAPAAVSVPVVPVVDEVPPSSNHNRHVHMADGATQEAEAQPAEVAVGFKEASRTSPQGAGSGTGGLEAEEPEPPPEGPEAEVIPHDPTAELYKAIACAIFVVFSWGLIAGIPMMAKSGFVEPTCTEEMEAIARVCEPCSSNLIVPMFSEYEKTWPKMLRAILYFIALIWTFLGVAMVCDQFMASIEEITNAEKLKYVQIRQGSKRKFHVKVWNPTVANLTLMALGSSAPEILLAVIEIVQGAFFAGPLGPSTIVGSAAFNLLMISAVCVSSIPAPETRKIEQTDVFIVTASFSILAYVWLLFILQVTSPDQVTITEGAITLAMFPGVVILAFLADKGILCFWKKKESHTEVDLLKGKWEVDEEEAQRLQASYGKELPPEVLKFLMLKEQSHAVQPTATSRAALRKGVTNMVAGAKIKSDVGGDGIVTFGFTEVSHTCLECAGTILLKVAANKQPGQHVKMRFRTLEGSAKAGVRYQHIEGFLDFGPSQMEKTIEVELIDDDKYQDVESFACELYELQTCSARSTARVPLEPHLGLAQTTIEVLNDDMPGTLSFDIDEVYAQEGVPVSLGILRTHGCCGRITTQYKAVSDTAVPNRDYMPTEGTLVFEHGEAFKTLEVPILNSQKHYLESAERFKVVLENPSEGVKFDVNTDGGETSAICDIVIGADRKQGFFGLAASSIINTDKTGQNFQAWSEQIRAALYCNGSPEEQSQAGAKDWFFHIISLTWKVLFSAVPPPGFCGGWLCFCCALGATGGVTAFIGDLASNLGCCLDMKDLVVAITLVALGTSLPDTFASRLAAQQDDNADNSIGNITGSNCVNVFLGLGLPWTIAALYWNGMGRTDEWESKLVGGVPFSEQFPIADFPIGGFMVPAGDLGSSVAIFSGCAVACLSLMGFRRFKYGGELGGPRYVQYRDASIMASLWGVYILMSIVIMETG